VGSDIELICRKAAMFAIGECINSGQDASNSGNRKPEFNISRKHFKEAIKLIREQNNKEKT
ncbi:MAG: hypothetical protein WA105_04870, partial [Candidatus Hydromicrobium sp.]